MRRKKYYYLIIMLLIICTLLLIGMIVNKKNDNNLQDDNNLQYNNYIKENQIQEQIQNTIAVENIKEEAGVTADSNLYQVDTEYDGRKVLNVKPDINFRVAFAGLFKKNEFEINEVEKIYDSNFPAQNGIWIEESSREKFKKLLQECTKSTYTINESGYLLIDNKGQQNEYDIILEKIIDSGKKIIISINDYYYEVDNITGKIVKYPFEKLDNYQSFDTIISKDNFIIVISSNYNKKITNSQIIEETILFLNESIL